GSWRPISHSGSLGGLFRRSLPNPGSTPPTEALQFCDGVAHGSRGGLRRNKRPVRSAGDTVRPAVSFLNDTTWTACRENRLDQAVEVAHGLTPFAEPGRRVEQQLGHVRRSVPPVVGQELGLESVVGHLLPDKRLAGQQAALR